MIPRDFRRGMGSRRASLYTNSVLYRYIRHDALFLAGNPHG